MTLISDPSPEREFKSYKATRGRDPYCVTGEFWRGDVVVDGQGGDGLRGVDVVVVGEAVVGGFALRLCPLVRWHLFDPTPF